MSDDTQNQEESQNTPAEVTKTEHMIPKTRFDEVNNKLKQLQKQIDDTAAAQADKEKQSLLEQNKYKELYEALLKDYEPLKQAHEKASRYQSALEASNQARLDRIPEDKRGLIPEYDDPVKLGAWLDRNLAIITEPSKPQPPNLNGAAGGGGSARESASALSADAQSVLSVAQQLGYSVNPERAAQFARNPKTPTNIGDK